MEFFFALSMFSKLENLFQHVDQAVASIGGQHPGEVKRLPGAGCCHAVCAVSCIEAASIANYLKMNPGLFDQLRETALLAAVVFEKLAGESGVVSMAPVRCPLLAEAHLCLAQAVRPITCRTYGTSRPVSMAKGRGATLPMPN